MRCLVPGCTAALLCACGLEQRADGAVSHSVSELPVLPVPCHAAASEGRVRIDGETEIAVPENGALIDEASWFVARAGQDFGARLTIATEPSDAATIRLRLVAPEAMEVMFESNAVGCDWRPGGYVLRNSADGVLLSTADEAGAFYGLTTLWQLLSATPGGLSVPQLEIIDRPRFAWRGLMLDSARHLQSPEFIRRYIDWMAVHKLNVLHWHLTDDQGWRLEIKSHPELTATGAWRTPAYAGAADAAGAVQRYGGYYTQDEVRAIVRHAATRHVTIVPEVDVPGHVTAALVAYPELGVAGGAPQNVPANWGIYDNVLNLEDRTLRFFEDVLAEVMELFPSHYVHLGGDEVVPRQWLESARTAERMDELGIDGVSGLQSFHFRHLQQFLAERGRQAIGWDEIVEGDIPREAAVMSWRGIAGGIEAAESGHDVVLSPAPTLYLDHRQSTAADAPPGRGPVITTEDIYAFDPLPDELELHRARILGVQGNLWTEHVRQEWQVGHMSYPRAAAIAELGWSPPANRDWPSFLARLAMQYERYERLSLAASDALFAVDIVVRGAGDDAGLAVAELGNQAGFGRIRYTNDGSEPHARSAVYSAPLTLQTGTMIRARTFFRGQAIGRTRSKRLDEREFYRREDRELELCEERLVLALEDDAPAAGPRESYLVDIMNPCWIMRDVPTSGVRSLRAAVGQVPFNFEIGDAIDGVVVREAHSDAGELVVRADDCNGRIVATAPLAPATDSDTVTVLPDSPLTFSEGTGAKTDLCFYFTRHGVSPIWVIDWVQLLAAGALAP